MVKHPSVENLLETFGEIDIYLFDQLLKGRFPPGARVLDAGCGGGRNLVYLLRHAYDVCAVDLSADAVGYVRQLAANLNSKLPPDNFIISPIEAMPFTSGSFDAVISCAVLHFADDERHFDLMLDDMWRVLKPGGILFARLATSIGIEALITPTGCGRYLLPGGTEWFLADEAMLFASARRLEAEWLEPLKTTNVQNQRCMTTWVLRKMV